jgi:thimet oligopeptidase
MTSTHMATALLAVWLSTCLHAGPMVLSPQSSGVGAEAGVTTNTPFFSGVADPASLTAAIEARLNRARQTLDRVLAVTGKRTVDNTLRPYDDLKIELGTAFGVTNMLRSLHPDAAMRKTAGDLAERAATFSTELSLNRKLYDAVTATDISKADAATRHYVARELRDYRKQGVEKDDATRQRITALRAELDRLAQEFERNIRSSNRTVRLASAAELAGLPPDFIAARKPAEDGSITLTTNAPDVQPVMTYAKNGDVRRRLLMESQNIGYPANLPVIERIITIRAELARTLGEAHWADYDLGDRMAGNAKTAADFIDRVVAASAPKLAKELALLLARKRQDEPGATVINVWERRYYTELVRRASYAFDSQTVRPYLPYARVRDGILNLSTRLFGFEFRRTPAVPVWHPSVETYEVSENGQLVGRVYLDMHPRPDKGGSGASVNIVRAGVKDRQVPELVLTARLSGGDPGDPGLMTHDQLTTFLHEFGHVIQALSAGGVTWIGLSRVSEGDFIESPSQMLEEWAWDPATLATFAKHYQTGEPIPAALVQQMRRAGELGRAFDIRQQMVYASLSLSTHDRDPKDVDIIALHREFTNKYQPMPFVEGTHFPASFGHLVNPYYASAYYTYIWSLVIAKDLYSRFDPKNLLDPAVARRYRAVVLAPAGSKPATALVEEFLGRPFSFKAWEDWLNYEVPTGQ